jgi:uncharacterized membrane protein
MHVDSFCSEMADYENEILLITIILGLTILAFYVYLSAMSKVFRSIGFTAREASTIILVTLLLGSVWIPIFPYGEWWVAISIGGALIPIAICLYILKARRAGLAEAAMGTLIVAFVTYFVTRAEEGVGIVADVPLAFAPALAAGLFSISTFWTDMNRAAPVAYISGVLGTIIGADVFRLSEVLAFTPPESGQAVLVVGGAAIFDMVYLTGIVAVLVDVIVFWVKKQQSRYGYASASAEFERGARGLPYAETVEPAPKLRPDRRRRIP